MRRAARWWSAACLIFLLGLWSSRVLWLVDKDGVNATWWTPAIVAWWILGLLLLACMEAWLRPRLQYALACIVVVIGLGVSEVVLRLSGVPFGLPPLATYTNADYHHLYASDDKMFQGMIDGQTVVVSTNEDGLRSRYSRDGFSAYPRRIAVLGDSFAFGFGVPDGSTFTDALEARLRQHFGVDQVAVLNAGIISSSPLLQLALYRGIVQHYRPTHVLLLLDPSDFADDWSYAGVLHLDGERMRFEVPDAEGPLRLGHVAEILSAARGPLMRPLEFVRSRLGIAPALGEEFLVAGQIERSRFFIYRYGREVTEPFYESTLKNIVSVAASVRSTGASFAVAVNPRYQLWDANACPRNWERAEYREDDPYVGDYLEFMLESRARVDFPILNMVDDFRASSGEALIFEDDPHWNARGSQVAAGAVAHDLMACGVLE
jgi:hypothetical protein